MSQWILVLVSAFFLFESALKAQSSLKEVSSVNVESSHCGETIVLDPLENNVVLAPQSLEYNVTGSDVKMGSTSYRIDGVNFQIDKDATGIKYDLKFSWPKGFMKEGIIFFQTNPEKKILFKYKYNSDQLNPEYVLPKELFESWPRDYPFRFCASDEQKDLKRSICSKDFVLHKGVNGVNLRPSKERYENEVTINDSESPLKGLVPIAYNNFVDWKLKTKDGSEFEIITRPVPFALEDFWRENGRVIVSGRGSNPENKVSVSDDSWSVSMPVNDPHFYILSENGVSLRQDLSFPKAPLEEKSRARLVVGSRKSSYLVHVPLHGCTLKGMKLNSKDFGVSKNDDTHFDWDFKSENLGFLNKSKITLLSETGTEYVGHYSVFRGYPFELAGRVSAAFASQGALVLGELQGSAWLEQIFSSENRFFSLLRWGASVGYLTSFVAPTDPNSGQSLKIGNFDGEIKYRFTPGIWNQIETWGGALAFQNTSFGGSSASMLGPGLFWVKPMPSALDKLFNSLVFLRYPKIIEFGAQYFLVPVASSSALGPSLNLTLRGKLFLKPNFFIDGALGYRQVQFTPQNQTLNKFSTVFGTGGLGFEF